MNQRGTSEPWRVAVALAAAALVLRVAMLSRSLWLDEGLSLAAAHHLEGFDAARPLYFWCLQAWMSLGAHSEVWLRLPSVVFGVASVVVSYFTARRFGSPWVATITALLSCCSVPQAFHSQEVRMYTLAPLLLVTSVLTLLRWLERPSVPRILAHGFAAYFALLAFPPAALGLGVMWLLALWSRRRSPPLAGYLLATSVVVTALWVPFALTLLRHPEATSWVVAPRVSQLWNLHGWALFGTGLFQPMLPWKLMTWASRLLCMLTLALAFAGAYDARRRAVALWYFGIVGALFVVSVAIRPLWTERYFMPFFPALFLLIAGGLDELRQRVRPAAFVALALLVGFELVSSTATALAGPLEDWRGATALVSGSATPDDVVVVSPAGLDASNTGVFSYYYRGQAPVTYFESSSHTAREWQALIARRNPQLVKPAARMWLVLRASTLPPGEQQALNADLQRDFSLQVQSFQGVDVLRLAARPR